MSAKTTHQSRFAADALPRMIFIMMVLLLACYAPTVHADDDLVVDGLGTTIEGGTYRIVLVKNNAPLRVNGTLVAQEVYLESGGVLTVTDTLQCNTLVINSGSATVLGQENRAGQLTVKGELATLGTWNIDDLVVATGGTIHVRRVHSEIPRSGYLSVFAQTVLIEKDGSINGDSTGNDPRGQGNDWYSSSSAGGNIGIGGRGYWDSSGGGNVGQVFGSSFTYESLMGGAGGKRHGLNYGGAGILIEAEQFLIVRGSISANGQTRTDHHRWGGGAGGTILLRSPHINVVGNLSANGGDGAYYGGGGGGGAIKVFYGNADMSNLTEHASAIGGVRGGYLNTQNGGLGSVYRNYIPHVDTLLSPSFGESLPHGEVMFRFSVQDLSKVFDERTDSLSPMIELSTDGFESVAYSFNHAESLFNWNKASYEHADTVEYTVQSPLPSGAYQWRVLLRDRSVWSRPTIPQTFFVGSNNPPNSTLTADIALAPHIIINGAIGTRCAVEYTDDVESNTWHTLAIVTIETKPHLYLDANGIGKPRRLYRLQQVP